MMMIVTKKLDNNMMANWTHEIMVVIIYTGLNTKLVVKSPGPGNEKTMKQRLLLFFGDWLAGSEWDWDK